MFFATFGLRSVVLVAWGACLFLVFASPVDHSGLQASRSGDRRVFHSCQHNDTRLRYVRNSGVCETTPGVGQMSGHVEIGTNMSMWFWFFEARQNPEKAPLTLWINGGPGCSSMIGLFQEHGPCSVLEDGQTTELNPYSWNEISNMIYIDQPIGAGFSYGTEVVNSTKSAAPFFWRALQVLFESKEFSKFQRREFVLATESFGGHYVPAFITYFNQQNELISKNAIKGVPIVVNAMMINNGWHDPLLQYKSYIDFATNAPGYGQLQPSDVLVEMNDSYFRSGGCRDQLLACNQANKEDEAGLHGPGNSTWSDTLCSEADEFCLNNIFSPAVGNRSSFDLRQDAPSSFPANYYLTFLANETIKERIGADVDFQWCSFSVNDMFVSTGDDGKSFLPQLESLINTGLKTLIWAGDTDINCNWLGIYASVRAMSWFGADELAKAPFTNMTINGSPVAEIQNAANFSFARVLEAGHEVPAFKPEVALEIFSQILKGEQLHSI